jgi:phosphoribosylaminoimidazole carboxylase PurE protein
MSFTVAILSGSPSDSDAIDVCAKQLEDLGVPYERRVLSAHRQGERLRGFVAEAEAQGCSVFICMAGMAAHLPGVVASLTTKPVLGVPLKGGLLDGLDALLSVVQMPKGVPVATLAVGKAGARNAALLAAQILALGDESVARRYEAFRAALAEGS